MVPFFLSVPKIGKDILDGRPPANVTLAVLMRPFSVADHVDPLLHLAKR